MTRRTRIRFLPVVALAGTYLLLSAVLRTLLFVEFGPPAGVSWVALPAVLGGGLVNDAVQSLYLFAPLTLLFALLPDRWCRAPAGRATLLAIAYLVVASLVFVAVAEYFFFAEFDARFNIVAFDYLVYPTEVLGDIRSEYPLAPALLATAALAALVLRLLRPTILLGTRPVVPLRERLQPLAVHATLLVAAVVGWPTDALSLSENRVANELVQNGASSFFRAARTNEIDYASYYATRPSAQARALLVRHLGGGGGRFTDLASGSLDRAFAPDPNGLGRLNVVVVVEESLGAEFSRLHGGAQDLTPNLDALARRGVWFANAWASGTRTVRGLEALTSSFPPIPTVSILRRPGNEDVATWGKVMRAHGYATSFLYGGYGYFDNMNAFYAGNGFEVLDRGAIRKVRHENVWGVADEDLFDRALEHFDEQHARGAPFFSMLMTTSNHKPFTFRPGLESLGIPPEGGGRAAGVRYADYALGEFLRAAEHHPWFQDTLFVVVADHGARVYGAEEIPLETYSIPLLLYAPAHLAPRRVDTPAGQIDVAPTVLGLLGLGWHAPFFGQDVLRHPEAERVLVLNHNHDVALLRGDRMVVLGLQARVDHLARDPGGRFVRAAPDPALEDLAIAWYQTASELFRERRYR